MSKWDSISYAAMAAPVSVLPARPWISELLMN